MRSDIVMVFIASDEIENAATAAYEAEESMKLESGAACFSPRCGFLKNQTLGLHTIGSEEIGLQAFKKILEQLESDRQNSIAATLSEHVDIQVGQLLHADSHDTWKVSEALRIAAGCFGYGCPCWDATNQTSDLTQAIKELSEDETYWLVPIEIVE